MFAFKRMLKRIMMLFLVDTYDTLRSGVPAAIRVAKRWVTKSILLVCGLIQVI